MSRLRLYLQIITPLLAAFILSQFFRTATAVIAPDLAAEMALSPSVLGLVAGAFFVAIGLMQLPVGMLLDRYGPRRVIPALLTIAVGGAFLFSRAEGAAGLIGGQAMIGFGCAGVFVGGLVTMSRWFDQRGFAAVSSMTIGISGVGTMISGTPFALVVEAIGWRESYLILAAATAAMGLWVLALVRDAPPGHSFHERTPETLRQALGGIGEVLREPRIWALIALAFASYAVLISIRGLWGGPYLADIHNLDAVPRGNILLAMSVCLTVGAMMYGVLARWGVTPNTIVTWGAVAVILDLALMAAFPLATPMAAAIFFCVLTLFGTYAVQLIALGRTYFEDRLIGRAITVVNLANFAGASTMQIVPGVIIDAFPPVAGHPPEEAYRTVFGFLAAVLLVALVAYRRLSVARQ